MGNETNRTLLDAFDYQIKNLTARIGSDIAISIVKKDHTCRRKVKAFLKSELGREDIYLSELSGKFIFQLGAFLRSNGGLRHNALMKNMQQFKRVIEVAVQNEWLSHDPFTGYSTAPNETERGFLSDEELKVLEKIDLPSQRLEKVRDLFLFSCFTGLAYADVAKLSHSHFTKDADNTEWIVLSRTKSKSRAMIPLLPKARTILKKYTSHQENGRLLPVISNQNINKYLKEIAQLAGIRKRVSFHLARHTFATTVTLNKGVDIVSVSKMLGHKNLRITQIYAKVSMKKIANDMKFLLGSEKK